MVSLAELAYLTLPELRLQVQEIEDKYLDLQDLHASLVGYAEHEQRRAELLAEISRLKVQKSRCNLAIEACKAKKSPPAKSPAKRAANG